MSKRTIALIAILAVLASVLVVLALSPKQQPSARTTATPTGSTVSPTEYPKESVLTLSPNPVVLQLGTAVPSTVNVELATGSNDATAVQLEITYDPKMISVSDITPGTFFDNPLELIKDIKQQDGRITYALGIQPTANGKKGTGTVAKLSVTPLAGATGQTMITLLPKTLVTASGVPTSVLKDAVGTSVVFTQAASQ